MAKPKPSKVSKVKAKKASNGKKNVKTTKALAAKEPDVLQLTAETDGAKKPRGLLDLPPEIWSKICKLAVKDDSPVLLKPGSPHYENPTVVRQPGITRVCRRIREECLPEFYRVNHFVRMPHLYPDQFHRSVGVGLVASFNALFSIEYYSMERWSRKTGAEVSQLYNLAISRAVRSELDMTAEKGTAPLSAKTRRILDRGMSCWRPRVWKASKKLEWDRWTSAGPRLGKVRP
ncbi:hypothetical protein BDY17DRAFT_193449 [Neohortaea acidophila]|uniref:Uncharacterized protein n=1 Tax=Neohortaea acidophila TaxID=245834 RepID=A0A6A6PKC7_9PEZI|nr:uncharacterized protein BDY17DRAFT_193449 [Neohortaea acidophila]KAF2480469.1 hypothetical protein BDY17DRAFT_193449 [Neohortaea acidophila]